MTVSSQTNNATFVGNGVTTVFPLPFRFFSNGDVFAYFIDQTTGASTPMVLGTDYTLAGAAEPEVNGNAVSVLTTTAPLANGRGLYVERIMQEVQSTDIVNQGEFFASTHEDVFDRLTMLIQQANANSAGAIRVAIGDPEPTRLVPAVSRANMLLGFDSSGNPIAVAPVSGSAADLAMNLANDTDPAKGVGLVGRGIQVVKTLTELRALLKTSPSKFAFVTDVGHYLLDVADVSSADNGGTLIVANDGGRWKHIDGRRVTNQMWEGNGAIVERIGDRLLVGGAVKSDARYPNVEQDWLATYQSYFYPGNTPPTVSTLMNVLGSDTGPGSAQAFLAGAHSSSAGASGGNAIGVQGYGIANNLTFGGDFSWGFYGEGHRAHSGSGNCYGMEICVVNRGTVKSLSPYYGDVGSTIGIQIDSGCGFRNTVMTDLDSASAALVIVDNTGDANHVGTAPFLSGIVFKDGSLAASSGFTAIALPQGYKVRWYTPSNSPSAFISCGVTTASSAQGLLFTNFGTQITNNSQAPMVTVPVVANPVNFLQLNAAATGERVRVEAAGADENIDLGLDVKGAGHIRFGTYTTGAVAQAGYITIKDAGGTVRRLLVG